LRNSVSKLSKAMKAKDLIAASFLALLPCTAFGQGKAAPLTRVEILGRLAIGFSPSELSLEVKERGIGFRVSEGFLTQVKLAGGDGILVERLAEAGSSGWAALLPDEKSTVERLAKCAEMLHKEDFEDAKDECWASMDENAQTYWPIFAAGAVLARVESSDEERAELIHRLNSLNGNSPQVAELLAPQPEGRNPADAGAAAERAPAMEGDRAEAALPFPAKPEPEAASTHVSQARYYALTDDYEKALGEVREALRLEPDNPDLHNEAAVLYGSEKNFEEEIAERREAVRIVPYGYFERQLLANALKDQGHPEEAVREWEELTFLSPKDERASVALAEAYEEQNEWQAAVGELKRILELRPESPMLENELAWAYATSPDRECRRPEEALALARRAVEATRRQDANVLDTLAEALLINGRAEEALKTEEEAAELAPYNAQIQSRLERFKRAAQQARTAKQ
jgi:tetratricopeptide (TPR) repeat protein